MDASARTGNHNPRTVYVETADWSRFVAAAMSDRAASAIADALNASGVDVADFVDCPDARRTP